MKRNDPISVEYDKVISEMIALEDDPFRKVERLNGPWVHASNKKGILEIIH